MPAKGREKKLFSSCRLSSHAARTQRAAGMAFTASLLIMVLRLMTATGFESNTIQENDVWVSYAKTKELSKLRFPLQSTNGLPCPVLLADFSLTWEKASRIS